MAEKRDDGFLTRWSRQKRAAARTRPRPPPVAAKPPITVPSGAPPVVNPAALPPLDSIDAATDIVAFLAAAVPTELMRAALRRAWSADPAIRDFVGLSENSWDFTAPDGVPGFGPLSVEDARRLFAQLAEEAESQGLDDAAFETPPETARSDAAAAEERPADADGAPPQPRGECETPAPAPRPRHGGALPR